MLRCHSVWTTRTVRQTCCIKNTQKTQQSRRSVGKPREYQNGRRNRIETWLTGSSTELCFLRQWFGVTFSSSSGNIFTHSSAGAVRGAGIAQWLERRTRDWKVAGSNPCWNGGRIFFSRVDFLCWVLFLTLISVSFHPRVTKSAGGRLQLNTHTPYVCGFIEPCFGIGLGIGHNLSLICQMTSEDIKHQLIIIWGAVCHSSGAARCESRGGRPELSVLTSLLVSVDVKNDWTVLRHWSQLVPNLSTDIWGH